MDDGAATSHPLLSTVPELVLTGLQDAGDGKVGAAGGRNEILALGRRERGTPDFQRRHELFDIAFILQGWIFLFGGAGTQNLGERNSTKQKQNKQTAAWPNRQQMRR